MISIKPLTNEVKNGGTMCCTIIYKNFKWKIQGENFVPNVFIVDLNNYDMVLGFQ